MRTTVPDPPQGGVNAGETAETQGLHLRVSELEADLRAAKARAAAREVEFIEIPTIDAASLERLGQLVAEAQQLGTSLRAAVEAAVSAIAATSRPQMSATAPTAEASTNVATAVAKRGKPEVPRPREQTTGAAPPAGSQRSAPQQRILDAVAALQALERPVPAREEVPFWLGVNANTGSFNANVSALKAARLLEYPREGGVRLTPAGVAEASATTRIQTARELQLRWLAKLRGPVAVILRVLLEVYPQGLTRGEIAAHIGVKAGTGSFNANVAQLKTLGLATYPGEGMVAAADLLFSLG